ncbi:tryptophan 2,3-dioxygenase family protein [Nocardioides convexus]|uniref:tryptophan 2,3-dioxygenase family protein n=1 Tax=Nocardioides convexus TaxID=2712224 RepID=UPI0024186071|nr:tryptophan 2,3-dioxygenase family protein [Nocardioides convexus]
MSRRSVFDSFLRYLGTQGYDAPAAALDRDLSAPWAPSEEVQDLLLRAYADDGGAAQVAERLVDLDEGLQEWRYRHVKMVERTIGAKMGTGGSSGATYLWSTVTAQALPRPVGHPEPDVSLAEHYSRFRVTERLLLTGHSHQAWPDVAREGVLEAYDDAALALGQKWPRAEARAERLREGVRALLGTPGAEVALGASTHELLLRFLSTLDLRARPRLVTTDGEFHSARQQAGALRRGRPGGRRGAGTPGRDAGRAGRRGRRRPHRRRGHLLGALRDLPAGARARHARRRLRAARRRVCWSTPTTRSGRYRSRWRPTGSTRPGWWAAATSTSRLGEGNCFLRVPPHADGCRPVITRLVRPRGRPLRGRDVRPDEPLPRRPRPRLLRRAGAHSPRAARDRAAPARPAREHLRRPRPAAGGRHPGPGDAGRRLRRLPGAAYAARHRPARRARPPGRHRGHPRRAPAVRAGAVPQRRANSSPR